MAKKEVEYDTNNDLLSENISIEKEQFEDHDYYHNKDDVCETTVTTNSNNFNPDNIKKEVPSELHDNVTIKNEVNSIDDINVQLKDDQLCDVDTNVLCDYDKIETCPVEFIKVEPDDAQQRKVHSHIKDEDVEIKDEISIAYDIKNEFINEQPLLMRCEFCKIYLEENEYLEYHQGCCSKNSIGRCVLPAQDQQVVNEDEENSSIAPNQRKITNKILKKNDHRTKKTYKCSGCSYETNYERNLKFHVTTRHQNGATQWSDCNFKSLHRAKLKTHLSAGQHGNDQIHKCLACEFSAADESDLVDHAMARHHELPIYDCVGCKYRSVRRQNLSKHVRRRHRKITAFNCSKCTLETYDQSYFAEHVREEHGDRITYKCVKCDYETDGRSHLMWHVKAAHRNKRLYVCSRCSFEGIYIDVRAHEKACHPKRKGTSLQ